MSYAVATRDQARAAPFLDALAPLGLVGLALPLTTTAVAAPAALEASLGSIGPEDRIGLASARASAVVAAAVVRLGLDLTAARWWAVGDTTAEPLRRLGYHVRTAELASAAGLAAALLDDGAASAAAGRVLLPRAADGRDEAALALRQAGVRVDEIVAYRTVAVAAEAPELAAGLARWRAGEVAVAALFAPSQVAALGVVLAAHGLSVAGSPVLFAAIGGTTGQALVDAGAGNLVVADAPTPAAMANAVASRYPPRR